MHNKLLDVDEIAELLGVPKSWIYDRTRRGKIPHRKLGKYLRFDPEAIQKWLEEQNRN